MAPTHASILVIRGGAIGDFILTLPVLAALRRQFPEARLEVLGYPHIAQLALAAGLADDLRSIEAAALAGFFARGGILDPALQDYFARFAIIISYQSGNGMLPANAPNLVLAGAAEALYQVHFIYAKWMWVMFPVLCLLKGVILVLMTCWLYPATITKAPAASALAPMSADPRIYFNARASAAAS